MYTDAQTLDENHECFVAIRILTSVVRRLTFSRRPSSQLGSTGRTGNIDSQLTDVHSQQRSVLKGPPPTLEMFNCDVH